MSAVSRKPEARLFRKSRASSMARTRRPWFGYPLCRPIPLGAVLVGLACWRRWLGWPSGCGSSRSARACGWTSCTRPGSWRTAPSSWFREPPSATKAPSTLPSSGRSRSWRERANSGCVCPRFWPGWRWWSAFTWPSFAGPRAGRRVCWRRCWWRWIGTACSTDKRRGRTRWSSWLVCCTWGSSRGWSLADGRLEGRMGRMGVMGRMGREGRRSPAFSEKPGF